MNLIEKAKNLPTSPGVYLMKDSLGNILYVGKSKNLRNRVSSYFQSSKAHSPKVLKLVDNLKDFEYILTDTEFEAFMLECKLIKEIKPRYNRKMKSPLSYSYIKINTNENSLYFGSSEEYTKDNDCLYWGPYTSKNTLERGIEGIKGFCKIPCSSYQGKSSPCLNYSLNKCHGICLRENYTEHYINVLNNIIKLLSGEDNSILEGMESQMNILADGYDFENAAKVRDYIGAIKYLQKSSRIIEFSEANKNIVVAEYLSKDTLKLFLIKGNKLLLSKKYNLTEYATKNLITLIENDALYIFKTISSNGSALVSKEDVDEALIIYNYLHNKIPNTKYAIIPQNLIDLNLIKDIKITLATLLG